MKSVKAFLFLTTLILASTVCLAQEADLNKAFQSEYVYLVSQKEALLRQKNQMKKNFGERLAQTKNQVTGLQKQVVALTAQNDDSHEELTLLERQKKDLQKRGSSLESTYKKASKTLNETERGLRFDTAKDKSEVSIPLELNLADLTPLFKKATQLLEASSQTETFKATYIDENDKLAEGEVTRVGRVAAFVNSQEGRRVLGPNGMGNLKTLEAQESGLYLFESLNEAARIEKAATWIESLADLGPLAFLALMLALVGSLFIVLVKV